MHADRAKTPRRPHVWDPVDVLYVDDDDAWGGLVVQWLTDRGFKILRLSSAVEMRSYLSRCRRSPRCLLLDLTLKDGDGLELCDEVKNSPAHQHLAIVILTGRPISVQECMKHEALYRVQKDSNAETELAAVLDAVLLQEERTRGVIDAGDLRLDPHQHVVFVGGEPAAMLQRGPFSAFRMLIQSSPRPVPITRLYEAFLERAPHHKSDPELSVDRTVRNYISRLRASLGADSLGARIVYIHDEGYLYRAPKP